MRQPFLHDAEVVLRAPAQVWSRGDGDMRAPIDGVHVADLRILSDVAVEVTGSSVEHIRTVRQTASTVLFTALLRGFDGEGADPRMRLDRRRTVDAAGVSETLVLTSGRAVPVDVELLIHARADLTPMPVVKAGGAPTTPEVDTAALTWGDADATVVLDATDMRAEVEGDAVRLLWRTTLPPHGRAEASWRVHVDDRTAVVTAPRATLPLRADPTGRGELDRWVGTALADLEALQLVLPGAPDDVFLAAGAPWFLTLFGRDAIWAARLLLPLGTGIAGGTLRVLARLQGTVHDPATGEHPGGILHELRRGENALDDGTVLPPRYFGTIDATPLWILLLHDAWAAGLPDDEIAALLPNLRAALRNLAAAVPAGGFLAYFDAVGTGLANQGWKDSGDSVQWGDGHLAAGPIALCEVQAYAYEAAEAAADLLFAFGAADEAATWTQWAADLRGRFRAAFWIDDEHGGHPAIALDRDGLAVDSLTSNIGHLLGTGLLDAADEARIAALLVDPRLDAGLGLRTLATDAAGYWPLSYHGGSVWAHDTAIAIRGLIASGFRAEARVLAEGLLRASTAFDGRMPELHGGEPSAAGTPLPYPAACRPQAWSAAAAIVVRTALTGPPDADSNPERSRPTALTAGASTPR